MLFLSSVSTGCFGISTHRHSGHSLLRWKSALTQKINQHSRTKNWFNNYLCKSNLTIIFFRNCRLLWVLVLDFAKISPMFWGRFSCENRASLFRWTAAVGKRAKTDFRQRPSAAGNCIWCSAFRRFSPSAKDERQPSIVPAAASTRLEPCCRNIIRFVRSSEFGVRGSAFVWRLFGCPAY